MMRIVLVNPNTDWRTTEAMVAIAAEAAGSDAVVAGLTAERGVPLIADEAALSAAAVEVLRLAPAILAERPDAVVIAAFGDPALPGLRGRFGVPVTGICEAAMIEAGHGGRRFGVVTTTPALEGVIAGAAALYPHGGNFRGTWTTRRPPQELASNPGVLIADLAETSRRAIAEGDLDAVIIGGGPLARAARALDGRLPAAIVEPVPAAVRLAIARVQSAAPAAGG